MIKCSNLYKSYSHFPVLKDINLSLSEGEIVVITGPSGSGKTTLLKCLSLLENPDKGTVDIDGEIIAHFPADIKRVYKKQFPNTGVVFQSHYLWPHLTNAENITLAFNHKLDAERQLYYGELIDRFKVNDFIYKYPNQSSLGQRQRIALIRTLIQKPRYLFLDEITSSLDIEQASILLKFLEELRDEGVGIFLITHFLLFAQKAANQVVFIEDGSIIEAGNKSILHDPQTERLQVFINSLNNIVIV
jgi:ABC-type polar amino acid transport system ATPase subunit